MNGICRQNDGAGHHWTGERAASGLVKAGNVDEPGAPQFSLLIEGGIEVLQFPILFALLRPVATSFAVLGAASTSSGTPLELHSRCAIFTGCICVHRDASGYTQANIEGHRRHLLARGALENYTVDVQFSPAAFASAGEPQAIHRRILKATDCIFLRGDPSIITQSMCNFHRLHLRPQGSLRLYTGEY